MVLMTRVLEGSVNICFNVRGSEVWILNATEKNRIDLIGLRIQMRCEKKELSLME